MLPLSGRSHSLCFKRTCFEDAQKLVLTLRTARGNPIPPCPCRTASLAEKVRWLLYLFTPEATEQAAAPAAPAAPASLEAPAAANEARVDAWLGETFGGSRKWLSVLSDRVLETSDCEVVTAKGVMSVAQFLREKEEMCHGVSSSSLMIVLQLQTLLPKEVFNRLVQVAAIRYPSPIPVIRAMVMEQNKDWGALFDQDPGGFMTCLKQATLMIRRSFSSRSFHIWTLC